VLAAAFGALAFLFVAARAATFFFVVFPAVRAVERAPAFAATAFRARLFAALRGAGFRAFLGVAGPSVSSWVNRSLSSFINFRRRESAVVTSRIASLPSVMRV
jgi:hypothetical protein